MVFASKKARRVLSTDNVKKFLKENHIRYMILPLRIFKPHEKTKPDVLRKIKNEIKNDGILKRAILVDKNTNVVIDGHHRLEALRQMGYSKIGVQFIDYQLPEIKVESWKRDGYITKEMVINAGISGKKLPPKISKNLISINGKDFHVSKIEKVINVPLEKLK